MSGDREEGQAREHQDELDKGAEQDKPDDLWRLLLGITDLGALYFAYRQNEGAAQIANALGLVIRMFRRRS